jgi:hypothetical protein
MTMSGWEEYLGRSQELADLRSDADRIVRQCSNKKNMPSDDRLSHKSYEDEILQSEKIKARSIVVDSLLRPGKFIA